MKEILLNVTSKSYLRRVCKFTDDVCLRQHGVRTVRYKFTLFRTAKLYRKMVIIRNPFDRLVSAYNDKFLQRTDHNLNASLAKWLRQHRRYSSLTHFQQFVKAVLSDFRAEHWNPYALKCHFNAIKYDDVIRMETFRHDIEPFLTNYLGVDWKNVVELTANARRSQNSAITSRYLPIFKQISRQDRLALKEMYRDDLQLLGYDFDVDTLMTSCRFETVDGHVCC